MSEANPSVYVCEEVREVLRLHRDIFTDDFRCLSIRDQLDRQARRILEAHQSGDKAVVTHIQCWHPEMVGHPVGENITMKSRDDGVPVGRR